MRPTQYILAVLMKLHVKIVCLATLERCSAVVKRWIQDRELASWGMGGLTPASNKCCVLEQKTLSTLLSTGFYLGRPAGNTLKMKVLRYIKRKIIHVSRFNFFKLSHAISHNCNYMVLLFLL